MAETRRKDYEEIIKRHPEFDGVISKKSWDYIGFSDEGTVKYLGKLWEDNIRKNVDRKLWRRNGAIVHDCKGIGRNKSVVAIGAGSCLKKNQHVLKQIHDYDAVRPWPERNFIFVSSNHMFKPLLKDGIIPDFVMLADASDVVLDQLTKNVPESGKHTVLLAGLHCSPKVLKRWTRQGREIRFYLTHTKGLDKVFEEVTGEKAWPHIILQGGNVLNSTWSIGLKQFGSTVFFALGNDLSYPLKDTVEEQRKDYYADGDYSSNDKDTGTGRDEAGNKMKWMGFNLRKKLFYPGPNVCPYEVEIEPVGTSHTLWVYKTWLEANVLAGTKQGIPYHYYNCTEGGIAGVMCKDDSDTGLTDENNWFLMDEVCKRWKTRMLEDAAEEFIRVRRQFLCQNRGATRTDANTLIVAS